jgi:hypothetical protein
MEQIRLAPLVGIAGSLAVVAALAYPYVAGDGGVGAYYGSGVINPLVAGLLAIVTVIILAAGREGRTDPEFAAGAGLIFGLFVVGILLAWGLTVRVDAVAVSENHRWLATVVAAAIPVSSLWFARTLELF